MSATNVSIAESLPDRIKLDKEFDVERMREDAGKIIADLPPYMYYSTPELLDGEVEDPLNFDWASEPMLKDCYYFHEAFRFIETEVTSIRLMRLGPGDEVKEHCDPMLDACHREVVRLTVPIFSDASNPFFLNGTEVPMQPGETWYLQLSQRHSVKNSGSVERINMSIDLVWNDWLENWLASQAKG